MRKVPEKEMVRRGVPARRREQGLRRQGLQDGGLTLESDRTAYWLVGALLVCVIALFIVLAWAHPGKATEYSMISRSNIEYCDLYAKRAAATVPEQVQAYGDCIRVLPTRLPMPEPQGTVPASDKEDAAGETWSEACDREYRTWDPATGTVVRRGSPDRVECPLVLKDGEWVVP